MASSSSGVVGDVTSSEYVLSSPSSQESAATGSDTEMQMDCAGSGLSVKTTDLMADLTIGDNNERELGDKYLNEHGRIVGLFQSWSEEEQLDFMERVLQRMGHYQIGHVDRFIRPMLQRDFIANLPAPLAENILKHLDAKALANCEAVSTGWRRALAVGQMWRKLIEQNVRTDNLWRGLSEKRKWKKFVLISRETSAQLICEHNGRNYQQLKGTPEMVMLQHKFYRELYPKVIADIRKIDHNWKNGQYTLKTINCNSQQSKGVYCLQYDDEKIVSGLRDNTIKIWDRKDLSCSKILSGHTGSVLCLQYDNRVIISGSSDATVRVWDVNTGECLNTLIHHCEAVLHLRFSDGVMVTCSKDRSIAVWDMVSPREINIRRVLVGHRAAVNVVDFDERYIVSASGDRTIKVWSADNLEFVRTLSGHKRGIACLQYRGRLVVSGSSDNTIRLWDIISGVCLRILEGHEELVRCIRFDDKRIVSGAYDGKIKVWDLQAALDMRTPPGALCLSSLHRHTGRVFRLQFDDFQIVSSSHDDTILIWDFLDADGEQAQQHEQRGLPINDQIANRVAQLQQGLQQQLAAPALDPIAAAEMDSSDEDDGAVPGPANGPPPALRLLAAPPGSPEPSDL